MKPQPRVIHQGDIRDLGSSALSRLYYSKLGYLWVAERGLALTPLWHRINDDLSLGPSADFSLFRGDSRHYTLARCLWSKFGKELIPMTAPRPQVPMPLRHPDSGRVYLIGDPAARRSIARLLVLAGCDFSTPGIRSLESEHHSHFPSA